MFSGTWHGNPSPPAAAVWRATPEALEAGISTAGPPGHPGVDHTSLQTSAGPHVAGQIGYLAMNEVRSTCTSADCHPLGPVGARPLTTEHQESQAVAGGLGDPPAIEGGALENSQVPLPALSKQVMRGPH